MYQPGVGKENKKTNKTSHPTPGFTLSQEQTKKLPQYTNMLLFYFLPSKAPSVRTTTFNAHISISKVLKGFKIGGREPGVGEGCVRIHTEKKWRL